MNPKMPSNQLEVEEIKDVDFAKYLTNNRFLFVDFYATWCQPCQRFLKIIGKLAYELDKEGVKVVKMDTDLNEDLSNALDIEGVPTFILYDTGKQVLRWSGFKTIEETKELVIDQIKRIK